jgi:hypothetical protein
MKKLLELTTTMQSAALLGDNMNFYNKKKKKSNDFVKQGVKNIFGVSLIKAQADIIGGLK